MSKQLVSQMVVAAGILAALFPGALWAQLKHPIAISSEGVKSRYVQQLALDVGDVPGHQVRVQESQRTFPADNQPTVDGERIVEWWGQGYSNYVGGIGPAWGYVTSESAATETGSKRGTYHGTSRFLGGTGRFSKIRGYLVDETKFDTDPKVGYNVGDSRGEYWFEQ